MDEASSEDSFNTVEYALINLVRLYPVLYNTNTLGHRDKNVKDSAWSEIGRQLNKEDGWCYTKWQNLRDYYKKRKKIYESGTGCMSKRWIYFDAMQFLDPYEHRDRDGSNNGLINLSELSSGSSRSNDAIPEHIVIPETADRDHYFDETQYHSLDGITERAEVKISHFLEPLIEICPPAKKQRVAAINTSNGTNSAIFTSTPVTAAASSSTTQTGRQCHHHHGGNNTTVGVTPSIVSVQSKAESQSQTDTSSEKKEISKTDTKNPNEEDCPHYHFRKSLLARFKKMTPANATFAQMRIMEALMKTEHPEEIKRMAEENS